jgi:hypothetical protein
MWKKARRKSWRSLPSQSSNRNGYTVKNLWSPAAGAKGFFHPQPRGVLKKQPSSVASPLAFADIEWAEPVTANFMGV